MALGDRNKNSTAAVYEDTGVLERYRRRQLPSVGGVCSAASAAAVVRYAESEFARTRPPLATFSRRAVVVVSLLVLFRASMVLANEDELDGAQHDYRPGLVVIGPGSRAFHCDSLVYASESRTKATDISWRGLLHAEVPGEYRFALVVQGGARLQVAGKEILGADAAEPRWCQSAAIDLRDEWTRLEVNLKQVPGGSARVSLFWSGPGFDFEPVPSQSFYYLPEVEPQPRELESTGRDWARALRCDACHLIDGLPTGMVRAPALDHLNGSLRQEWCRSYLTATKKEHPQEARASASSPSANLAEMHARFSPQEARDVTSFLWSLSTPTGPAGLIVGGEVSEADWAEQVTAGSQLALTLGCLACHRIHDWGTASTFGGGDLSRVAAKRPSDFFVQWLTSPSLLNQDHRMPVFDLTDQERRQLAAYLSTLGGPIPERSDAYPPGDPLRGELLVKRTLCRACHRIDAAPGPANRIKLSASSDWSRSCLNTADQHRFSYRAEPAIGLAIREFVQRDSDLDGSFRDLWNVESILAENNCLSCHARSGAGGLLPSVRNVVGARSDIQFETRQLLPPSLDRVGDKLHARILRRAVLRQDAPQRPWLRVRMPRFPLSGGEADRIVDYFVLHDRVESASPALSERNPSAAAARLVTADGFGCLSCHDIGAAKSNQAPGEARGPDLLLMGRRLRRSWFDRWVRNPARMVPNMEMPSVQVAVPGLLDNDLDRQLSAVWELLNQAQFRPPDARPVRTVRQPEGDVGRRSFVLTDVMHHNGRTIVRPLLVALPNRHNVLFDLGQGRLAGWWVGDAARQRTAGKTWFWEAAGRELLNMAAAPDLSLLRDGREYKPSPTDLLVMEPDEWRHTDGGVQVRHRLRFFESGIGTEIVVHVSQRVLPLPGGQGADAGWRRIIEVDDLDRHDAIAVRLAGSVAFVTVRSPHDESPGDRVVARVDAVSGRASFVLDYRHGEPPPPTRTPPPAAAAIDPQPLESVPGFRATRLALTREIMPTGFAWRPDGSLIVSSLKGRVWMALDTDGDHLEDKIHAISDELATPFGLHATTEFTDVVTKYGLVRLHDDDGDGVADRSTIVASGWGYTEDYHDWAVGIAVGAGGIYHLALPCQQDDRSLAEARLRGTVVELRPRQPTTDNARLFEVRPISHGHRFPMGIATNQSGWLFVTDNQGNYNPFNELNHVLPGVHFGFINKLDRGPGPHPLPTPPSIEIPHPWTRSVNGICFLETPRGLRQSSGRSFGPFENHLVGCEYDTRQLIRMSLDVVDGWIQGAAYPFSRTLSKASPENSLLGPLTCAVAPDGDLYVGCIRDSGWGGGSNTGTIVRLVPDMEQLPPGIAEVRAMPDGFVIDFTQPLLARVAEQPERYSVWSFLRISTPAYGGEDVDRRRERINRVTVATDLRSVQLTLAEMREGRVYEFRLRNVSNEGGDFFPAEAYYTLRRRPH